MSTKEQLINDIIDLNYYLDEMYVYHPDNPNKVDVVEKTIKVKGVIRDLTAQIEELGSTPKS